MSEQRHTERKGYLFVLEGIDGAGKTAAAIELERQLQDHGYRVVILREPTNESLWGKEIRSRSPSGDLTPREELELFLLDRKWHVEHRIRPALEAGLIVLLDRYFFASGAYQSTSTGLHWSEILRLNRETINAPEPDLVFLLDVPVEIGLRRLAERNGVVNLQFEQRKRLELVRTAYLDMLNHDHGNFVLIDATQPLKIVVQTILKMILDRVQGVK